VATRHSPRWRFHAFRAAMAIWCVVIMAISVPLALRRFNRTLAG
jgi:hypothetical protein